MKRGINGLVIAIIFLIFSLNVFAAGGGGGGSSPGLGFSGARESVFILVSQDYSVKFSLKNRTKYDLKFNVEEGNATVNFGNYFLKLKEGDNYMDLNDNGFADVNFNLVKVKGRRADIRIIDAKDQVPVAKEEVVIVDEIETEPEEIEEDEQDEIKCLELKTVKGRVSCRLDLDKEEQKEELELYYLPEECGAVYFTPRKQCIERYNSVQECWQFPIGNARISCVKRVMNLGTLLEEKKACGELTGKEKSVCVRELKNKVYNLIKWKFYDLEERAEDFMIRGLIDKGSVVDFIVKTEENKVKFNEANSKEGRKNIVLDVRIAWNDIVKKVKENIKG